MTLGPFDITAERIQALGTRFSAFVNRLLELEVHAGGINGYLLAVNANETTPDGGVDASVRDSPGTDFLPIGDSAWQFKRGTYGPQACADEFQDANWAHEYVRNGGSYVIVLAAALPDNLIESRRREVAAKAVELGLLPADDASRIRVYDANRLARWASKFPSLAVSPLSGGPGSGAVDFDTWSDGRTHDKTWVPDDRRAAAIDAIGSQVTSTGVVEVRVQGESGVGKTRLVLEALRDPTISPLVAYVADERSVGGELLTHLVAEGRTAILVVDECPAERHVKLVERLPSDPAIKLITIGDTGAAATRTPVIGVGAVGSDTTEEFLRLNYRQLPPESRRFVTDHSRGNMRWTIVLADRVAGAVDAQAAELIARNDIEQFVATLLPEGRDFFCSAALALLERVGWDGDLRHQLELLASFAGASIEEMESAAAQLAQRGLLIRLGRYRSVTPQPLAVYLAAEGWRIHAERLVSELLPRLDEGMALAFFRRVADLGRFEPARSVLPQLLSQSGPFSSLDKLESGGLGRILTQLAIVLPDEVAIHLWELIEQAESDRLQGQQASRRDLVWTLEKLVWHSRTFETAADSLLRLALAENETYANNAAGTWINLFGTMLPRTAASPSIRFEYLSRVATAGDRNTRLLAVRGAARSLVHQETITVSGELQGGVLVEPRGTPATYGEAGEYRRSMTSLLADLTHDPDAEVAAAAEDALINAVHPMIDDRFSGQALADALVELRGDALRRLRASAEHLISLYGRHDREDRRVREQLITLLERLPPPDARENLEVIVHLRRWDLGEGQLEQRVIDALQALPGPADRRELILRLLHDQDVPASWELGRGAALVDGENEAMLIGLVQVFAVSPSALIGYLSGLVAAGNESTFDDFLESELAQTLSLRDRVAIAVRGAVTERSRERILMGIRSLAVAEATYVLFGWHRNLTQDDLAGVLNDWTSRIQSQEDYNAVVDWLNLVLDPESVLPPALQEDAWRLVMLRSEFPDMGQQRWDWSRLATGFVPERGPDLARLILNLIDSGGLTVLDSDYEAQLLGQYAQIHGEAIWAEVAERLTSGAWRLQMELREWFLAHVSPHVVTAWVGTDVERARIVASMASVGEDQPTPIARFLLEKFGDDREVAGSLYGSFVSGFWTGNESDRIARQIEQLSSWRHRSTEPVGVRNWAREVVENLERSRQAALQREAEEFY
ncbi:MAG: hypothetical protein ACR2NT_05725 [Acidimicrobiia bacterium]